MTRASYTGPQESREHGANESTLDVRLSPPRGLTAIADGIDPKLLSAMRFLGSQEMVTTHDLGVALEDIVEPSRDYTTVFGANKWRLQGQAFYTLSSEVDTLNDATLLLSDRLNTDNKTMQLGASEQGEVGATVSPQHRNAAAQEALYVDENLTLRLLDCLLLQRGFDDNHRDRTVGVGNKVRALIESARVFQAERKAQYEWVENNGDPRSLRIQRIVRSVGGTAVKQLIISLQSQDTLPKGAGQLRTALLIDTGMQTAKVKSPPKIIVASAIRDTSNKKLPHARRNELFEDVLSSVRTQGELKKKLNELADFLDSPDAVIRGLSDVGADEPQLFEK